jgi:hypothetical protein
LQYFSFENRDFSQLAKHHSVYNTAVFENTAVFFQNCEKTSLPNTPKTANCCGGTVTGQRRTDTVGARPLISGVGRNGHADAVTLLDGARG